MITREECEKALNTLQEKYIGFDVVDELIDFKMLIEEHFDNPPLKFEELEEEMWVWDNKDKEWVKVVEIRITNENDDVFIEGVKVVRLHCNLVDWCDYVFEENRFYRKQVEE